MDTGRRGGRARADQLLTVQTLTEHATKIPHAVVALSDAEMWSPALLHDVLNVLARMRVKVVLM
jgi:hypothetical protein